MNSHTLVPTEAASRYLVQLCKHWSHKFPDTQVSEMAGRVPFSADCACSFSAEPGGLAMRIEAADAATLDRMEGVVAAHLKRFAFREALGEIAWTRG